MIYLYKFFPQITSNTFFTSNQDSDKFSNDDDEFQEISDEWTNSEKFYQENQNTNFSKKSLCAEKKDEQDEEYDEELPWDIEKGIIDSNFIDDDEDDEASF